MNTFIYSFKLCRFLYIRLLESIWLILILEAGICMLSRPFYSARDLLGAPVQ